MTADRSHTERSGADSEKGGKIMLEEVRKFGLEIPKPSKEEQEILDKMKEFIKDTKSQGLQDSDTDDLVSGRFAPESTMTDGVPESTMEVARLPIDASHIVAQKADILCLPDDPNPPEVCDPIHWGLA